MKITKKTEKEILRVIEDYWDSYFRGDLNKWASYLPEDYRNIGTTKAELWNSKKEIVDFTESVIDQTVGMAEVRDKKTQIIPYEPYVMVHELGDLYVKAEEGWVYYAQFRLSSLLEKNADGWKILHQHGSYPDAKTDEGEAFGFDELKVENKKLRDAIKSRTIELEQKNRDLEIESALERVRAVAMSMKNSKELQAVSEVIFKELITLGFSDLRNTEIIINQDEKQSILSYYYSDYGVSGEIEVDYTSHPVLKKWADDMKTAGDGFASVHISEEEMEGWKQYRLDLGYLPDPKLKNAKSLDYYSYSTGLGALSISSFEPINEEQLTLLERFRNVFGLAYRRYADVVQAEAQAREAKIEAALERVRARSMAMHKSDELGEVIQVVFDQLVHVGFFVEHTGFIVDYKNNEDMHIWLADPKGVQPEITIPYFDAPHWNSFLKAKEKGLDFFANHLDFKEKNRFYRKLFKFIPGLPQETIDFYLNCPGLAISTVLLEDVGLYIENFSGTPYAQEENEILMRFGKVFQQAYTRFLDLQKAEAQAREAQIEAALERVRSRTMAMHQSKELTEVVSVMYENMEVLGLAKWGCAIIICREETEQFEFWLAELTASNHTNNYFVKGKEHPVYRKIWDHWEAQGPPLTLHHQDEYKREFDEYWLNKTDFRNLPDEVKASVFDKNEVFLNYATMRHGLLNAISFEQPSNELMEGLDRFAKVFEQTYTRFLDLEKAEAQARESQIEASLDRIRAASMAMHNSEELSEVGQVFLNQIEHLAIPLFGIAILVVDEDTRNVVQYMVDNTRKGQEPTLLVFEYKIEDFPVAVEGIELLKKGKTEYTITSGKKKIGQWVAWVKKYMGPERAERLKQANLEKVFFHTIHFHGLSNINFTSLENLSTEKWSVMRRLVATFARSYRRFLDLQKAEAQAREAQVEAALERVRARAMAMHVSSELSEVVAYLYRELNHFGMGDWGCNIMIFNEEKDQIEIWLAESEQRVFDDSFKHRTKGHTFIAQQWDIWRKQKDETVALSGKIKRSYDDYVLKNTDFKNLPVEIKAQIRSLEEVHFSFATMQYGMLAVIDSNKGLSDSEKAILKRFAKVFQQTYTRFLDLQKAEAQAREAQIEAALERVRSRTMAMHKSEELQEVVKVLYEQLTQVGLLKQTISIALCEPATHTIEYWLADYTSTAHISSYQVKGRKNHVFRRIWRAWKAKESTISFHLSDKSKKKFDTYLFEETGFKELPPIVKKEFRAIGSVYITCVNMNYGYLEVANNHSMPRKDVSIVQKFAKVFEQTYTRFLDLQKAEAQAREAQIEAALERVRARTMAMHKSSELADATNVLFDQIRGIGLKAVSGWITIVNPEEDSMVIYLRTGDMMGTPTKVSGKDHVNFRAEIDSWKKGDQFIKFRNPKNEFVKQVKRIFGVETEAPKDKDYFYLLEVRNKYGFLGLGMWAEAKEEEYDIYRRFTKVFEQTYTRFLDLQKAEAQAQEAQIEVALERVRAQTMAMHQSDELRLVTATVFEQLRELGFDIPLCGFIIYDKESGDSKHLLSGYGSNIFPEAYHVPRFDHPYLNAQWKDWKEGESFKGYLWEGALKQSVDEYYFKHTDFKKFPPQIKKQFKRTDHIIIYDAFMSHGALEINSAKPISEKQKEILQRFARVFEQTYTRFLDLQKAEAQAREAQIEAALERVRAASMAMHQSSDLHQAAGVLFEQLSLLGAELFTCGFVLCEEDNPLDEQWMYARDAGKFVTQYIPHEEERIHFNLYKAWKAGTPLYSEAVEGQELEGIIKFLMAQPSVQKNISQLISEGVEIPKFQKLHGATFSKGYLLIITTSHFSEEQIFTRFAKVFEQTYTRFLDLQRAEAQTRESRIEAALERLRAKAMSMHHSDELDEVLAVLCEQFDVLGIVPMSAHLTVLDIENNKFTFRETGKYGNRSFGEQTVALDAMDTWKEMVESWHKAEPFSINRLHFPKETLPQVWEVFHESFASMPEDSRITPEDYPDGIYHTAGKHPFGYIGMNQIRKATEEEEQIVVKFANEFGRAYQRFLDLQRAEAQAREAEIEAALERVRAQTMAMHNSEDVGKSILKMFEELTALGVPESTRFGIGILNHDDTNNQLWTAKKDGEEVNLHIGNLDMKLHPLLESARKAWKKQVPLHKYILEGEDLLNYYRMLNEAPDYELQIAIEKLPEREIHYGFIFEHGFFYAFSPHDFEPELIHITQRFSSLFAQTYRRYLDLVKAEGQAREAQIEAAVERVRAEAMAMHSSEDFNQTAAVLWEQVSKLEVTGFAGAGIALFGEDGYVTWYDFSSPGNIGSHEGNVNRYEYGNYPLLGQEVWDVYQQGEPYFVFEYDLPKLKTAVKEWESIKPSVAEGFKEAIDSGQLTQQWGTCGRITNGFLFFDQLLPPDEDSRNILLKMTGAFELAYQRFLDLQKAEAQAREKEIQLGLEKVRARAMAMRGSDELAELVKTVFDELTKLDIAMQWCMINIIDEATRDNTIWAVNPDVDKAPQSYDIRFGDWPYHQASFKAYQERKTKFVYVLEGKEKEEFEEFMFNETDVANISDEAKAATRAMKRYVHSYSFSDFGGLQTVSETPLSEESLDILARFGKVFDLTYTRFNDLKKAEAQAREAQIESAMERVRARAMAMQKADELVEVATLLRKEMGLLGVEELETSSIYIHNKTTGKTECWYAIQDNEKEENLISDHMHIDLNDTWVGRQMLQFYQSDETKTSILMQGSNRTEWINYCAQHSDLFSVAEFYGEEVPERTYHLYKFSNGYMGAASPGAISDESWNLLQRATKVFSLAYTRFSDLQMAEAQAREAQIELALERGRTQSMLMQHSDELSDVSNVFHEQLLLLGLPSEFSYVWLPDEEKMTHMFWATWSEKTNKGIISQSKAYTYPLDKTEPYTAACYEMWESEESVFVNRIQANEVADFFSTWAELVSEAKTLKAELFPDGLYYAEAYMKYGCFGINIRRSLSKEEQDILLRFSVEFERAYTRFLDLKKAEAQTREAQIEAALERVRAQTMAMHDSEDVGQCIIKLFSELITLGVSENTRLGIGILNHDNENMELWTASKDDDAQVKLDSGSIDMSMHPLLVNARNAWKENRRVDQYIIDGKEQVKAYFHIINTMPDYPVSVDMKKVADRIVHYDFSFEQGILYAFSLEELSEEMIRIFQRFSALFGQTYRRFLDLQKAEAQAREAKIEAALERVRSRTMAMHKAEELHEVVTVVVEKLVDLGVVLDANGVILCTYFKDSRDVLHWIASPDFSFSGSYLLPYFDHPIFSAAWESKLNGDDYFSKSFTVEEKNTFFEYAFEHSDYKHFPEEFKQWVFQNDKHSLSFAWSEHSAILIPSHTGVLPSDEDAEILKRFAKVFEQAYVRFMDLQKAEKQAKEALKQAALDRVRGEIASMRSTEDLNRITPVIWRELIALNVPFIRCGVFIVNEEAKVVEVYLTTPEGAALGVLNLPFDINSQTTNTVKYWREKAVYREHWDAQAFTDWTQSMIDLGQVKEFADYQGASKIPEELHLHFIPFKQGMLYVGDVNILPEEKIEMVKTLAEAFSIAYARYEDFVRLEQAKSAVEVTLEELKSTQAQLIQSEKMASLGELTAGIAHEIQNPLNFVNNFSEVSDEILDEMIEEIEKGDLEEVKAIAADIKQNLQKINHHGKRADAIVKGMLQHSRKSSGEKTPTDINLLADEYLRLAYHGLRAKDKSFNATLNTDFDTSMEKVLLIPQDIGRVLLNLFNNAFYAINEKKGANENGYQPTVTVRTRRATEHISIAVEDNGNGIPQHVIDKVFQPFFTTKPTGQGTGLGLSMSYDIVKSHGGTMEITTEDGVGTTFTITIPNTK